VLSDPQSALHPAAGLGFEDARAICASRGMRLPTAAEWQKAARGPAPSRIAWPWGDEEPDCAQSSFAGEQGFCTSGTEPVGSHRSGESPTGAQEMAGGVWEWVEGVPEGDPSRRLLLGGAWFVEPRAALIGHAVEADPAPPPPRDPVVDYRGTGARCAADATSSPARPR
jgi:formylglycine-generating enzyme required for sulfatase activity